MSSVSGRQGAQVSQGQIFGSALLTLGAWQEAMADVQGVDAVITDAPYSPRTHEGFRSGAASAGAIGEQQGLIEYPPLTPLDVEEFVDFWTPRTKRWILVFGDHLTERWWSEALAEAGWYSFAPIAWIRRDAPPRFSGDGPQRSAEWIARAEPHVYRVSANRPKQKTSCGSLPGHYLVGRVEGPHNSSALPGQKNLLGMRAIIRDYTEPGWLIADPFAGMGTTLLAASIEGRRSIGAEVSPETYGKASRRLAAGYTPMLPGLT